MTGHDGYPTSTPSHSTPERSRIEPERRASHHARSRLCLAKDSGNHPSLPDQLMYGDDALFRQADARNAQIVSGWYCIQPNHITSILVGRSGRQPTTTRRLRVYMARHSARWRLDYELVFAPPFCSPVVGAAGRFIVSASMDSRTTIRISGAIGVAGAAGTGGCGVGRGILRARRPIA